MSRKQIHLVTTSGNVLGASPYAWLDPQVDPTDYVNIHAVMRYAQAAERGKFDFIFLGDFLAQNPAQRGTLAEPDPQANRRGHRHRAG